MELYFEGFRYHDSPPPTNSVDLAAWHLARRYYRRFPAAHWSKWDIQSIKDQKWYRNIPRLRAARMRLGRAKY